MQSCTVILSCVEPHYLKAVSSHVSRLLLKVVCLFQGPPGPLGSQGNLGPPGEGLPGPKVGQVLNHVLAKGVVLNNVLQ